MSRDPRLGSRYMHGMTPPLTKPVHHLLPPALRQTYRPSCSLRAPSRALGISIHEGHPCSGCPSTLRPDRLPFPYSPSPGPPADPCPWPPSGLQGITSFTLAVASSSFHVPGWLPGSAEAQTWLHGNGDTVLLYLI